MTRITIPSKSAASVLMLIGAVMLATSAAGVGIDTSTSDNTTSVSEVQKNRDLVMDASKDKHKVEATGLNSTDHGFNITINGSTEHYFKNNSMLNISTSNITGASEGSHYNGTFQEADLGDVPIGANANKTMDLFVYETGNKSNFTKIWFFYNNTKDRSVFEVDANDTGEVFDEEGTLGFGDDDYTKWDGVDRGVNGSTTDVVAILKDGGAATDWDSKFDGLDSEEWVVTSIAKVEGEPVPVYHSEAPSGAHETYAVYESDVGGKSAIVYHLGDDHDDADEVEVMASSDISEGGVTMLPHVISAYGTDGALDYLGGGLSMLILPLGPGMMGVGILLFRREDDIEIEV